MLAYDRITDYELARPCRKEGQVFNLNPPPFFSSLSNQQTYAGDRQPPGGLGSGLLFNG